MTAFDDWSAPQKGRIRITALKAVQVATCWQSLVKVETDAGLCGYGEACASGPVVRGHLKCLEPLLLGRDPMEIHLLNSQMLNPGPAERPHVPTVSGVDIALWDIAGKALDRPVCQLLRGVYRAEVPAYVTSDGPRDWFDDASCAAWAEEVLANPRGWRALNIPVSALTTRNAPVEGLPPLSKRAKTRRLVHMRTIRLAYERLRKALDREVDIAVRCAGSLDLSTASALARAVAPIAPLWIEDPLPVHYSDAWRMLRATSTVPILTGGRLETAREFVPFLAHGAVDIAGPNLSRAGGLTGAWRIAEVADVYYAAVVAHNAGTVVQNAATLQFAAATRNLSMIETTAGTDAAMEQIAVDPPQAVDGCLRVPTGPGLGITLREDVLRMFLARGEPFWD